MFCDFCSTYKTFVFLEFRNSALTLHKFVGKPFDEKKCKATQMLSCFKLMLQMI